MEMKKRMNVGMYPKVPIIAVTAYTDENTHIKCLQCGMDSFMCKPLVLNLLKAKLCEYKIISE